MSVIFVRKELNKIIVGSDDQETYGEDSKENIEESKVRKIEDGIYVACAGNAHIYSLFCVFAEKNSLMMIQSNFDLVEYFAEFSKWADPLINFGENQMNPLEMCQFILIIQDQVLLFTNYHIRRLKTNEHASIGSGAQACLAVAQVTDDVAKIINAVGKTNLYCSGVKILEIEI